MKTKVTLLFAFLFITGMTMAQDTPPERPSDISVSEFDNFKNTAFDSHGESTKLKDNVNTIDKDVKNYSGAMKAVTSGTLKKDLAALVGIKDQAASLSNKLATLDDQGKELLGNTKKAGFKAPAAAKNTNKAISAVNGAKDNINYITNIVTTDTKLIKDELQSRGEPVE